MKCFDFPFYFKKKPFYLLNAQNKLLQIIWLRRFNLWIGTFLENTNSHLHHGIVSLLWPKSFSFFLSYFNLVLPVSYKIISKALVYTRKQNSKILVIVVKWLHHANKILCTSIFYTDKCQTRWWNFFQIRSFTA